MHRLLTRFSTFVLRHVPRFRPRYGRWYYRRLVPYVGIAFGAVPVIALSFYVFVLSGLLANLWGGDEHDQIREIFTSYAQALFAVIRGPNAYSDKVMGVDFGRMQADWIALFCGLITTWLVSFVLVSSYLLLARQFMDRIQQIDFDNDTPQSARARTSGLMDWEYQAVSRIKLLIAYSIAFVPMLVVMIHVMWAAWSLIRGTGQLLQGEALPHAPDIGEIGGLSLLVSLLFLLLMFLMVRSVRHYFNHLKVEQERRVDIKIENFYLFVGLVVLLALVAFACFGSAKSFAAVFQFLGPLATLNITLVSFIAGFTFIVAYSRVVGFSFLVILVLTAFVTALFGLQNLVTTASLIAIPLSVTWAKFRPYQLAAWQWRPHLTNPVRLAGTIVFGLLLPLYLILPAWLIDDPSVEKTVQQSRSVGPLTAFKSWLDRRDESSDPNDDTEIPVFIFSAPGGGIYSMTTVSLFLARLHDYCPELARHTFAISAVSGGALGATVFNAALPAAKKGASESGSSLQHGNAGCSFAPRAWSADRLPRASVERRVRNVIAQDFLSPVIAAFVPDLVDKVIRLDYLKGLLVRPLNWWLGHSLLSPKVDVNRARVMEASLETAIKDLTILGGRGIHVDHAPAWNEAHGTVPEGIVPALLLNTTWVEKGKRMVFAPFWMREAVRASETAPCDATTPVEMVGDRSLQSLPGYEVWLDQEDPSIVEAAVASARFPLIMPAWKLHFGFGHCQEQERKQAKSNLTASLVDGGYADSSGALTALDLFEFLQERIAYCARQRRSQNGQTPLAAAAGDGPSTESICQTPGKRNIGRVKLRLVLISEDLGENGYAHLTANPLVDSTAPLLTLFNVRSLIADQAVVRACTRLRKMQQAATESWPIKRGQDIAAPACPSRTKENFDNTDWIVANVHIDRSVTPLPLGWMLSETSQRAISHALGRPEGCVTNGEAGGTPTANDDLLIDSRIHRDNSCIMASVISVLSTSEMLSSN